MSGIIGIICALVIFGIIVTVHEFGHFIVARKCGIDVHEFP
ncbi:MAG: site-2 protease family protein [Oscillospiraceae bacterium]|nr:site-2 protease family protein [Oscillospiraceae bacterium]